MADNFVDAVKEHMGRLAKMQTTQPSTEEIVQATVKTVRPFVVETVKQGHVELVRVLRQNPGLLRTP